MSSSVISINQSYASLQIPLVRHCEAFTDWLKFVICSFEQSINSVSEPVVHQFTSKELKFNISVLKLKFRGVSTKTLPIKSI